MVKPAKPSKDSDAVVIGILAMQGAFAEHQAMLNKVGSRANLSRPLRIVLVREAHDLEKCDGLIIPGGESTTIALLLRLSNLLTPLLSFIHDARKPVWGTCAGAILLSSAVEGMKRGGQDILGGVGVRIQRNGWGSQAESFEAPLIMSGFGEEEEEEREEPFRGVFIRAPVVIDILPTSHVPPIQVLARLPAELVPSRQHHHYQQLHPQPPPSSKDLDADELSIDPCTNQAKDRSNNNDVDTQTIVALRQGPHLLTTFHPELTNDTRFHMYFVEKCVVPSLFDKGASHPSPDSPAP